MTYSHISSNGASVATNANYTTGAVAGQQIDIGNQSGIQQLTQGLWPG